jgi:hypothetical protein
MDRPKQKDPKIMLTPPTPTPTYMLQAWGRADVMVPADRKLVILDLNGTLLYRPDPRNRAIAMVNRPKLRLFLQYLFAEFEVMIWSSAKPQNVTRLTQLAFGEDMKKLVGIWGRDKFGLLTEHYSMNVQVYKHLQRVWDSDEIQRRMPGYEQGKRFDQRNTILVDDSSVKAAAQPHNLVEIPEFAGILNADGTSREPEDILGQVAGYLDVLKMQEDVSRFIHKDPFKADGTWAIEWERVLEPAFVAEELAKGSSTSTIPLR